MIRSIASLGARFIGGIVRSCGRVASISTLALPIDVVNTFGMLWITSMSRDGSTFTSAAHTTSASSKTSITSSTTTGDLERPGLLDGGQRDRFALTFLLFLMET